MADTHKFFMEDIPTFVFNTRKKLCLSQLDFGELLAVTRVAVNHWEKGISYPNKGHWNLIKSFSKIKIPPNKNKLKKALLTDGASHALYLILKTLIEENKGKAMEETRKKRIDSEFEIHFNQMKKDIQFESKYNPQAIEHFKPLFRRMFNKGDRCGWAEAFKGVS